jgi:hypothetical protein
MSAWCVRLFWCWEQQAKMAITDEFKLNSQAGRSGAKSRDVVATSGSVTRKKLKVKLKLGRTRHGSHD